jgi:hypothetical protein
MCPANAATNLNQSVFCLPHLALSRYPRLLSLSRHALVKDDPDDRRCIPASGSETALPLPLCLHHLFALIVIIAGLTWVIPAGQYERVASEALGKDVPVAGTYAPDRGQSAGISSTSSWPRSPASTIRAATAPMPSTSRLFVLMIGGFIGVVTATGAIDAGIKRAMARLKGREKWMIPILMALFALRRLDLWHGRGDAGLLRAS